MSAFSTSRLLAFIRKEFLQILRDPSALMIAVVLPMIMLFLFGFGVSLDANKIKIGLVLEDTATEAMDLAHAFMATHYFDVKPGYNRADIEEDVVSSALRGMVVIPQDFSRKMQNGDHPSVQVIADGSETNTANFVLNYAEALVGGWFIAHQLERYSNISPPITPEIRIWFNPELKSRYVLLPGSIAIVMTLIGILLTALVVAREWERGTMEAMMATPIRIEEMILGKLIPYFLLGLCSMTLCVLISVFLFQVPFRGSFFVLFISTAVFLLAALSQGLLISTATRNQFVSSQIALIIGFLPAFILSGFLFEINSMPWPIRYLTYLLPPRYFVSILQSGFLAGKVWSLILPNLAAMLAIAAFYITLTVRKTVKRLD